MSGSLLPSHAAARALVDWLDDGPTGPLPWRMRMRLNWNAFWFEQLLRSQGAPKISSGQPAFVMGYWRSGTTLLHNLLYRYYDCTSPLTWQCHAPASFGVQPPPTSDVTATRPMDDGVVHLLGPHEDEFALLLLGEPSLYRGFLHPSQLGEIADACLDSGDVPLPRWTAFVNRIAQEGSPLLLKSPNHLFRLSTIYSIWPDARMVWICRPFSDVLTSNLRMWRAMIDLHRLRPGNVDLPTFLERCAERYRDIVANLLADPPASVLWLSYPKLRADPDGTAAAAARFLGLAPRAEPRSGADTQVHPGHTTSEHDLPSDRLRILAAEVDDLHRIALDDKQIPSTS